MTSKVMSHSFGLTLVGLVGATVIVVGVVLVLRRALSGKRDVTLRPLSRSVRRSVEALAKVSLTARAVIIAAGVVIEVPHHQHGRGKPGGSEWSTVLIAARPPTDAAMTASLDAGTVTATLGANGMVGLPFSTGRSPIGLGARLRCLA